LNTETTAAQNAAPAAAETPTVINFDAMTSAQYDTFMETGEVPTTGGKSSAAAKDQPTNKEAAAASTSDAKDDKSDAKASPDPESGKQQEQPKGKASAKERTSDLDEEIKTLRSKLSERAELRRQLADHDDKKADTSTAKPADKAKSKLTAPTKPKLEDFTGDGAWERYEAAKDQYHEDNAAHKAQQAVEQYKSENEKATKEQEAEKTRKAQEETFMKRVRKSMEDHDDFEEKAFAKDLPIPQGSVIDRWILERELGAEVLYALGSDRKELARISALPPLDQAAELAKLELKISGTKSTKKAPVEEETVRVVKGATEVAAQSSAPDDEYADAVKKGDFAKFDRLEEKKERARHAR
jgi:hypothetical protein